MKRPRRPLAIAAIAAFAAALAPLAVAAPAARFAQSGDLALPVELSGQERTAALSQASKALNGLARIRARFTQIAPDGAKTEGGVYLERPGKLRFEYDKPSPLTIVADGATVAVADRALKTVDRLPLRSTPLFFVLKANVDLEKDARVTAVARQGQTLLITLRDRKGEADGALTLTFTGAPLRLTAWRVVDGQGQATALSLSSVTTVARHDPALFRIEDSADPTARRRGG